MGENGVKRTRVKNISDTAKDRNRIKIMPQLTHVKWLINTQVLQKYWKILKACL